MELLHQTYSTNRLFGPDYNLRFRVLSDKTVVGNLTDICQNLINLRSGVGGKIKEEELVTGSTSSLVSQLGSLCKHGDTEEKERINLKPSEVSVWCRTVINTC